MKCFTGIGRLFRRERPNLPPRLWNELLWLAREYPGMQQFRAKAIIAAAIHGVTEEQLMLAGVIERKPPRPVTSDEIANGVRR
jgi:hypothetical protein